MTELGDVRVVILSSDNPEDLARRVTLAIGEHARDQDELYVSHAIAPEPGSSEPLIRYTALLVLRPRSWKEPAP
jgi:hypothetical protein